jgi:polar amino acid transport system substrate-binding protein
MRLLRTTRTAAVAVALALSIAACGGDDGDDEGADGETTAEESDGGEEAAALPTISEGQLTVCTDSPYRPFEFEDADAPSGYSGFDIDLVQAMADELGVELVVTVTSFDAIQSGTALAAGNCDMAASAMTITEEREQNVDFLDPYFDADQSLLVPADGPQSLDELTSLGVQADTTGQAYAEENFDGDITEFDGAAALFAALEAGNVEGILQDLPVNAERAIQDDSVSIVETYTTGEQYGFAVSEGATDLSGPLNEALQTVRDNGTYDELYAEYFEG